MLRLLPLALALLILAACGAPKAIGHAWTLCDECNYAGMPANIFRTESGGGLACTMQWDRRVDVLAIRGGKVQVRDGDCAGWIAATLLRIE